MMRIYNRIVFAGMLAAAGALSATGVPIEQPVILNTGEAVVFVLPGQVEFKFVRHFSADTLQAAIEQYNAYVEAAPQAIRGSELQPLEIKTAPPLITSLAYHQVQASVTVRFSMAVFNTAKTGPTQFAALCDKMNALAETMKSTLASPLLLANDPDMFMSAAVARATENAYPSAEAVAAAVKTTIYAVDKVEVLETEWVQQPEDQQTEVPHLGCRAKVRVTYALAPMQ